MQLRNAVFALAVWLAAPAYAEESEPGEAEPRIEEVVVIGHPLSSDGLAQAHTVLAGDELERKAIDNIGETVASEAGIHNGSFGVRWAVPSFTASPGRECACSRTGSTPSTFPSPAATMR